MNLGICPGGAPPPPLVQNTGAAGCSVFTGGEGMHAAVVQLVVFRQTETQTSLVERLAADHFNALDSVNLCTCCANHSGHHATVHFGGNVCGPKKKTVSTTWHYLQYCANSIGN